MYKYYNQHHLSKIITLKISNNKKVIENIRPINKKIQKFIPQNEIREFIIYKHNIK